MMRKKILTIIFLLGFSLAAMGIGLRADTAGILPGADARQEKTEKKEEKKKEEEKNKQKEEKDKKVKRVWTDEDLKKIKQERVNNITEVTSDTAENKEKENVTNPPVPVTTTTKKYDSAKTEQYWRGRKKSLIERISNSEKEIKKLEQKLLKLNLKRGGDDRSFVNVPQLEQEIRETANKLESYKKGLDLMKQELENLPDEARKAGAPPGWLRD